MSKLDIRIEFDRDDRTYRGGDQVSGTVTTVANQDVTCNVLSLVHCWRTHGKGNREEGSSDYFPLYEGSWRAGETATYRFQFTAPDGPPTYRGKYLNIDHYVRVRAEVSWSSDPKAEEDFLLLTGAKSAHSCVQQISAETMPQIVSKVGRYYAIGSAVCLLLGMLGLFPFGISFIPLGLYLLWKALRISMLEKRLGEVQIHFGNRQVYPGVRVPVRLQFTPRKAFRINAITATLIGQEHCTSSNGTNTTMYTHTLYEETYQIAAAHQVQANSVADFAINLQIPETDAYSFKVAYNQIRWIFKTRIDIPTFPDWTHEEILVVLPTAEPTTPAQIPLQAELAPSAIAPSATPAAVLTPSAAHVAEPIPPAIAEPAGPNLDEVCVKIVQTSRYGDDRRRIIDELKGIVFDCEMDFDRIERTVISDDPRFRDGRTITGRLANSGQPVSVLASDAKNEEVDRLATGSRGRIRCKLADWDALFDRAKLHYV